MVPCKARAIGLGGAAVGSIVWGVTTQPIKKQRERWGLGLGWPPIVRFKQQSTQSVREDHIAEAGGEDSVGGYTVQSFGVANGTMKK